MFKNKIWLIVVLSIVLLIFSASGFTAYYKYTEESDHADALENFNEPRQILDDLGNLLGHSLRNDLYPKDGSTGGYLGRLNYGLDASKPVVPAVNDMYLATDTTKIYKCFVPGNWVQVYPITEVDPTVDTDAEIKAILVDEVTKTGAFTAGRIAKINNATGIIEQGTNTDTDVADAVTKKHTQNTDTAAGGEWDFGANSAGFTIQTASGDGTTTINWTLGNYFKFTHGATNETFTFNPAPTKPGHLTLIIIQDGVGGRDCTWPVPVKWLGTEPTWTDGGAGKGIVVAIVYDGTSYWSQGTPWEG